MTRSPFEVLGVPETATLQDIKTAYRQKVKTHHPDRDKTPGASLRFQEIQQAYEWLRDPARKTRPRPQGKASPSVQQVIFLRCEVCQCTSPHLRLLELRQPTWNRESFYREKDQHLLCPDCAKRKVRQLNGQWALGATLTLPVGFFLPLLLLYVLYQMLCNTLWAFVPREINYQVLKHNILSYLQTQQLAEAYLAAQAAVAYAPDDVEKRWLVQTLISLRETLPRVRPHNP
ncbi:J domain-containing protein [Deinococcus roseus]|uniref:J domain-containing protein n=1 Tax=Deinococcus roseus TaxID=392414 RepID=A0ABQ2DGL7_9DEIO|nr:J domain-containing protein [Deinococcus roseus]GGJ56885.1 hypothetical protein GCM10008938_48820 [Deinococcus roseus]